MAAGDASPRRRSRLRPTWQQPETFPMARPGPTATAAGSPGCRPGGHASTGTGPTRIPHLPDHRSARDCAAINTNSGAGNAVAAGRRHQSGGPNPWRGPHRTAIPGPGRGVRPRPTEVAARALAETLPALQERPFASIERIAEQYLSFGDIAISRPRTPCPICRARTQRVHDRHPVGPRRYPARRAMARSAPVRPERSVRTAECWQSLDLRL